jgi:hypothetical protein
MLCEALHRNGELYIPFDWFCMSLYNLHVSACRDVLYVTNHYSVLSANMADLLTDLLRG